MKKITKLSFYVSLFAILFAFTGCDDDDDTPINCTKYATLSQDFATDAQTIFTAFTTSGDLDAFCTDYTTLINEFQTVINQASSDGCLVGQDLTDANESLNEARAALALSCPN